MFVGGRLNDWVNPPDVQAILSRSEKMRLIRRKADRIHWAILPERTQQAAGVHVSERNDAIGGARHQQFAIRREGDRKDPAAARVAMQFGAARCVPHLYEAVSPTNGHTRVVW